MSKFKDKERILKAATEKELVMYKGITIRLATDFSAETLQASRSYMWSPIGQCVFAYFKCTEIY